jgi:hypothetical protein
MAKRRGPRGGRRKRETKRRKKPKTDIDRCGRTKLTRFRRRGDAPWPRQERCRVCRKDLGHCPGHHEMGGEFPSWEREEEVA